jgi:hypothetical protein
MHLEFPGDQVGGAVLLQAQFGVGVDVVTDGDELIPILAARSITVRIIALVLMVLTRKN